MNFQTSENHVPVLLLFLVFLFAPIHQLAAQPINCSRSEIHNPPTWAPSLAWRANESGILFVNIAYDSNHRFIREQGVRGYSRSGFFLGKLDTSAKKPELQSTRPSTLRTVNGQLILEDHDGYLIWYDETDRPTSHLNILEQASNDRRQLKSIFDWTVGNDEVLVFGDVLEGDAWSHAFVLLDRNSPSRFRVVQRVHDLKYRKAYLLGHPYLASIGSDFFFLLAGPQTEIRTVLPNGGGSELLYSFSGTIPWTALPQKTGLSSVAPIYKAVEDLGLPTALVAWNGWLYVLGHTDSSQPRRWSLLRIDPNSGQAAGRFYLPSHAHHLSILPGNTEWVLVEKGVVQGLNQQEVQSLVRIPSSWLQGSSSELLAPRDPASCQ